MDDIQARSVADALLYTSGITEGQNPRDLRIRASEPRLELHSDAKHLFCGP